MLEKTYICIFNLFKMFVNLRNISLRVRNVIFLIVRINFHGNKFCFEISGNLF